ncbi:transcriptional regulator GcvA [Parapusillimonas granuli]|uniref:Transcriptional regulator GcvA n=1 Tax=Parapusillimonas granuli TaxID=380911 RepID=A0A853FVX3_9BURK|nr:transcriptional regulator GcvA [Parapusillimonas granuli]MBB5216183.1 LysR family glycine cleavage system transcriptional activator [Parapusillimonas granuli]MEB2400458.1 transcriptional regulator GcvA [Alcaligenaceae bacterium]NYT47862.1 transcriptional regulator GcvA [Parapusillimonas granuli]
MTPTAERLPPLNALRVFETTARLLSMQEAALALHVTPAAVSKQIQLLEQHLNTQLFIRSHRKLALTPAGEKYYAHVSSALNSIRHATHEVASRSVSRSLKIRAYTTFSMYWLIPRLTSFHGLFPDINIELTTSLKWMDFDTEDVDAAIRLGDGDWPGLVALPLIPNILAAVCSPALKKSLHTLDDLKKTVLLHTLARPDDWSQWLASQGYTDLDGMHHRNYESSVLVYQAAMRGQGVGIAQKALAVPLIESGDLVYAFPHELDMHAYTYYFVMPGNRPIRPELKVFHDWLMNRAEMDG